MTSDMKAIGDMFRQRRKELNYSLKEVETATSIRTGHLQAIEEWQMEKLISPIYAQGFVKQYAAYLGLDGDRIVSEHAESFKKSNAQEFAYGIGTLEQRGSTVGSVKWVPNAIWVIAFFVLLVLAYYVAKTLEVIS